MRITNPEGKVFSFGFIKKSIAGIMLVATVFALGNFASTVNAQTSPSGQTAQVVRTSNSVVRNSNGTVVLEGRTRELFTNNSSDDVYIYDTGLALYNQKSPEVEVSVNSNGSNLESLGGATSVIVPPGFYSSGKTVFKVSAGQSAYFRTTRSVETKNIPSGVYAWGLGFVSFGKAPAGTPLSSVDWNNSYVDLVGNQITGPKTSYVSVVGEKGPNMSDLNPYSPLITGEASFTAERENPQTDLVNVRDESTGDVQSFKLNSSVFRTNAYLLDSIGSNSNPRTYKFYVSKIIPHPGNYILTLSNPTRGSSVPRSMYVQSSGTTGTSTIPVEPGRVPVMTNVDPTNLTYDSNYSFGNQTLSFEVKNANQDTDAFEVSGQSTSTSRSFPLNSKIFTKAHVIPLLGDPYDVYKVNAGNVINPITGTAGLTVYSPAYGGNAPTYISVSQSTSSVPVVTPSPTVSFDPQTLSISLGGRQKLGTLRLTNPSSNEVRLQRLKIALDNDFFANNSAFSAMYLVNLNGAVVSSTNIGPNWVTFENNVYYLSIAPANGSNIVSISPNSSGSLDLYADVAALPPSAILNSTFAIKIPLSGARFNLSSGYDAFVPTSGTLPQASYTYAGGVVVPTPVATTTFVYPQNGQQLNWSNGASYLFKATASGNPTNYTFVFNQNGVDLGSLTSQNGEVGIRPGDSLYPSIHSGSLRITAKACYANTLCASASDITVKLTGSGMYATSPLFSYPQNGQVLNYGAPNLYLFKVTAPGARAFVYKFTQGGNQVATIQATSDGTASIVPGDANYNNFLPGDLKVSTYGLFDNGIGGDTTSNVTSISVTFAGTSSSTGAFTGDLGFTYPSYPFFPSLPVGTPVNIAWNQNISGVTAGTLFIEKTGGQQTILTNNVSLAANTVSVSLPVFVDLGNGAVWRMGMIVGSGSNKKYFYSNNFSLTPTAVQSTTPTTSQIQPTTGPVKSTPSTDSINATRKQSASNVLSASEIEKMFAAAKAYLGKLGK